MRFIFALPIPYIRDHGRHAGESGVAHLRAGHLCVPEGFLLRYSKLPPSPLEGAEKLEQLRALSNGYKIKVSITGDTSIGIDTREDLVAFMGNTSMTKHIFVTGGVVSSLGKGLNAASIGMLLESRG